MMTVIIVAFERQVGHLETGKFGSLHNWTQVCMPMDTSMYADGHKYVMGKFMYADGHK